MKIARHCLRVRDLSLLREFYCQMLGMTDFGSGENPLLGFDAAHCLLELHPGAKRERATGSQNFYWKTGITVRDLDEAVDFLRRNGWAVTAPKQFRDIGYMSHLTDPEGFIIELLQHGFEASTQPPMSVDELAGNTVGGHEIGGQATLAHITLRVNHIDRARNYCENVLGMRLMSVQPVDDYGFCLYFYTWSKEPLPLADLRAVENRPWLWARPYALLELQHVYAGNTQPLDNSSTDGGFFGFGWQDDDGNNLRYLKPEEIRNWV